MASFVLDLPPETAIAFLESKKAFAKKLDEPALKSSARARATRIANLSSLEMTANIYESMAESKRKGQTYNEWVKDVMGMFERKGWVHPLDKKTKILADPQTGEVFGSPRRLETIYRTNMQAAFSAQEYQQLMDNVDSRPYWQYSAILDDRTRPKHSAMHGLVFRYDDPFWTTFYPPNGFNCRCSVKALKMRDIERNGLEVGSGDTQLVETEITVRKGVTQKTIGFKTAQGTVTADRGFDYNVGRQAYKPNLDLYPQALAHQFAKVEMKGYEFQHAFERLAKETASVKAQYGIGGKLDSELMTVVRNHLRQEYKFAAGVIKESDAKLLSIATRTAWLSDDTLIKQFNSREGQDFGLAEYALLPEVIFEADRILKTDINENMSKLYFYKQIGERWYMAVMKHLTSQNELFTESFRLSSLKQIEKEMQKYEVVRISR